MTLCNCSYFHIGTISTVSFPPPSTLPTPGAEGGVSATLIIIGEETPFYAAKITLIALAKPYHLSCTSVTHYQKTIQHFFKVDFLWLLYSLFFQKTNLATFQASLPISCNQGNTVLACNKPKQQKLLSEMLIKHKLFSKI